MRHRRTTTALACLGAVLVLVGGLISYAGHVVSNSEQFAARATSVLGNNGMRALIARRVTAELVARRSELIAVRPVVESVVGTIVGSAPFQSIFEGAVYDLHRSVFEQRSNTFTLRLAASASWPSRRCARLPRLWPRHARRRCRRCRGGCCPEGRPGRRSWHWSRLGRSGSACLA